MREGDGRGAEPSADKGEKTKTTTREVFHTAGHTYRFERPVTLSSGVYRCLAEELRGIGHSQTTENVALWVPEDGLSCYGGQDVRPETEQVLALLHEDSSEVRLAAAIWLFNYNDLWWIEQLDPPLRGKLEGRLLDSLHQQLRHQSQSLRCEAAEALVELGTDGALRVLIETLEDERYAHGNDVARGVQCGGLRRPIGVDRPSWSSEWSPKTALSVLKQVVECREGKRPELVSSDAAVVEPSSGPDQWTGISKEEKERRFRSSIQKLRSGEAQDRIDAARSLGYLKDRRAVVPLLFALRDGESAAREWAARSLGKTGDPRANAALSVLRRDPDARVRGAAIAALIALGDSSAVEHLLTAMEDDDDARKIAVNDLANIERPAATDALAEVSMRDHNEDMRQLAMSALFKRKDRRVMDAVLAAMNDDDVLVRCYAIRLVCEFRDVRALEPLLIAASGCRPDAGTTYDRRSALVAISRFPKGETRRRLLDELAGGDFSTRAGAALALGLVGDAAAVGPLLEALKRDDPLLRQNAIWALMRLKDERAVEPLIAELKRELSWSRVDAAIALGQLGDRRAVRPLCDALSDDDALVRVGSAVALGMLADEDAFDSLIVALADDEINVAAAAAEALAFIEDGRAIAQLADRFQRCPVDPEPELYRPRLESITEWFKRRQAVERFLVPLFALGWKPNTVDECVRLFWLLGKRSMLAALATEATPLLLESLDSDDVTTREHAARTLIRIGDEKTLPALISMLEKHGTDELALVYNCCGKQELITATQRWAKRHSKQIGSQSPSIQWGGISQSRKHTYYNSHRGVSPSYGPAEDPSAPTTTLDWRSNPDASRR